MSGHHGPKVALIERGKALFAKSLAKRDETRVHEPESQCGVLLVHRSCVANVRQCDVLVDVRARQEVANEQFPCWASQRRITQ